MIRLPREMSADDVSQWLHGGCYLVRTRMERGGPYSWEPATYEGMENGRVVSTLMRTSQPVRTMHTSCAAVWPTLGAFNHPSGYAVHMEQTVERQYRRTYNQRSIRIVVPWEFRACRLLGVRIGAIGRWEQCLWLPFRGEWPASLDAAMASLEQGVVSVAVNRRLIVAGDANKRLFYVDGKLAANAVDGRLVLTCLPHVAADLQKMLGGRFDAL